MPCVVPTCGDTVGTFKLFPQDISLSERWLEAIQVGCGIKVADADQLSPMEICTWHFAKPDGEVYQEPQVFNRKTRKVEIDSCRLCLRFSPVFHMVSKNGQLIGKDIKSTVYDSLGIDFQSNDFLERICTKCLARLDLLKSIQKDFLDAETKFHSLISIIRDNAKDISVTIEFPLPVKQEESDGGIVGEDSSDEWTPPKALVDIVINQSGDGAKHESNSSTCDGSKQPKLSLKEIITRKCYLCLMVLESASHLASHLIETHANTGANRCEECSRDFPTLLAYNKHLSRHDETGKPHKCSFCSIPFKIKRAKMNHENTHHGTNHYVNPVVEKSKPAICETCGESFMYMRKLKNHVQQKHPSNKPTCTICGKTFTIHASLERHMLLHTNEKPYVCSICDTPFRRLFHLKNHVLRVHEGKNPHVCAECNQEFNNYEGLYIHNKYVHLKKPKPIYLQVKCMLCGEHFPNMSDLQQHIPIYHAGESYPYFECPHCPRKFINNHALTLHKNLHTDKHACKECGKKCRSRQELRIHTESVHQKRELNCSICLKTYSCRASLQMHMKKHTDGKPFSCDVCSKSFHRNCQLRIHRRTHTGERPFECPVCQKRFGDDGTFSKHKKRCLATVSKKDGEATDNALVTS